MIIVEVVERFDLLDECLFNDKFVVVAFHALSFVLLLFIFGGAIFVFKQFTSVAFINVIVLLLTFVSFLLKVAFI